MTLQSQPADTVAVAPLVGNSDTEEIIWLGALLSRLLAAHLSAELHQGCIERIGHESHWQIQFRQLRIGQRQADLDDIRGMEQAGGGAGGQ